MKPEIVSALKRYTDAKTRFDIAEKALGEAQGQVLKMCDGKLPIKVVIENNFVVVAKQKGGIHLHVTPIDGIFGHPGSPLPRGTV